MPTGTPKLERIKAAVSAEFPEVIYGQYNCKRRNGFNWSQHAGSEPKWGYKGNAVDIVHRDHGYGDKTPAHQAYLDQVNAFLIAHEDELDLNERIWRKIRHFDHIHTSPWPKMKDAGLYRPPCKGGELVVIYENGRQGDTFKVVAPPPPPPNMEAALMSYADTLPTNEWLMTVSQADVDRHFDAGIHGGNRQHWKDRLPKSPSNPSGTGSWDDLSGQDQVGWENYRRTLSARTPYYT